MFQDVIRLTVQKIFADKLLLGLLIVCLLGFCVGGFNHKDDSRPVKAMESHHTAQINTAPANIPKPNQSQRTLNGYTSGGGLEPSLAVDFVKWWMKGAMDYSPKSAVQSHQAAANWMTANALKDFEVAFWTPDLAQAVSSGSTVGAFQPIAIQAEAINPDRSVVVGLTGTLILQAGNGRPIAHQIQMDILVRKGNAGLRIDGMYNRLAALSPSVY